MIYRSFASSIPESSQYQLYIFEEDLYREIFRQPRPFTFQEIIFI